MKIKILKQIGGTCGYYALINSLNLFLPQERKFRHEDVEKLLDLTIDKGYSKIGEIFSYSDFDKIILCFKELYGNIDFDYELKKFNKSDIYQLKCNQVVIVNHHLKVPAMKSKKQFFL